MNTQPSVQRRFEILREIASGGFGCVFLVRLSQGDGFSRVVAMKLLHPQWSENAEVASRMRDEARLLGLLRHRNIVDVLDLTRLDGRVAVVMEYLEAVDLKVIIQSLSDRHETMPLTAALQVIAQAASALDAAFNKAPVEGEKPLRVVHRDIKPSNVMVDAQGIVKVLDFGVARGEFEGREAHTQGMAFGSFDYMPSERRFMEAGGETSDVYSLGVVLFELIFPERFGKGKLKEAAHTLFVKERVAAARATWSGNPNTLDELAGTLTNMLAFGADQRPKPGAVANTLRRLARAIGEMGIEEWAERHVPPLLAISRAQRDQLAPNPLVGRTLIEDRTGDDRSLPPQDQPRISSTPAAPSRGRTPPPGPARSPTPVPGPAADATPTSWNSDIPKRVRDAAPARPPIAGTQTPAPLRRVKTPEPPPPPRGITAPQRPAPPPSAPQPAGPNLVLVGVWSFSILILMVGGLAFLVALWFAQPWAAVPS